MAGVRFGSEADMVSTGVDPSGTMGEVGQYRRPSGVSLVGISDLAWSRPPAVAFSLVLRYPIDLRWSQRQPRT